ncbi:MAG: GNAT family N-acetyltransferase [Candidatus Thermoplasmatota archaeon]|nr:GNAT family N-acetyltransferase [Candidatus Thermoplasmatota archaeon]
MKIIEYKPEFEDEYIEVHNRAFAGEESIYDNKAREYDEEGRILNTFLAEKEGKIVGLIDLVKVEEEEDTVEIDPICVLPEHRKGGIGSRLIERGIEWAERKGYERVRALISFRVREWLYDFFEEHGFERVSKIFASKDGEIVEVNVDEGCPFSEEVLKGQVYVYERRISGGGIFRI